MKAIRQPSRAATYNAEWAPPPTAHAAAAFQASHLQPDGELALQIVHPRLGTALLRLAERVAAAQVGGGGDADAPPLEAGDFTRRRMSAVQMPQ